MNQTNKLNNIQPQLSILENSENLLTIVTIGSIIRLGYFRKQKKALVDSKLHPKINENTNTNEFCIELLSSLLTPYGIFGFRSQSKNVLQQSCKSVASMKE